MWKALMAMIFISSSMASVPATTSMSSQTLTPVAAATAKLAPVAIGSATLAKPHLRAPREEVALSILQQEGVLKKGASQPEITAALKNYYNKFYKNHGDWMPPDVAAWDVKREAELATPSKKESNAIQPVTANIFALAVQFGATEVLTMPCMSEPITMTGPVQGRMAFPKPGDNNTLWYSTSQTADVSFYNDLVFGYQGVGRVRYDLTDPTDGQPGINLAGRTVQDYYDNVAGKGNVTITGTIDGWVTVNHSEGYYGAPKYKPSCKAIDLSDNDSGIAPVGQIVVDALDVYSTIHPTYYTDTSPNAFWKKFDQNHDGYVDAMWILHAGADEAAGGGAEGQFAIWSFSWALSAQGLSYKVYEGDPTTAADDIYVEPYTVQPENADLGVLVEEFGHNFFLWPDLYDTDSQNSIGDWTEMSGGSWMGWVGGTAPAGMPLWFRMIAAYRGVNGTITALNWQEPMTVRNYDDAAAQVDIGNLERTDPTDTRSKGVRINIPAKVTTVKNLAGSGNGAWAESTNSTTRSLSRQFTLDASASHTLTIDMYWDTEQDFDYGYIEVNGVPIKDTTGYTTDNNPNGGNLGWGLTGTAPDGVGHTLSFDLSAYAGTTITLDLVYTCDPGTTQTGVWVDNVNLDGALVDNFDGASESTFPGWNNDGWKVVPFMQETARYYLVEWRTKTKYDEMVKTAYVTTENDANLWRVERVPYNIPGALVYYRDASYGEGYSQQPFYYDPPSFGPKNKLLVVDMNFWPMRIDPNKSTSLNSRAASYDAALTIQPSEAFTLTKVYVDPLTTLVGPFTFASKPAITGFNDGKGKYAGFFVTDGYYYSARDNSAVIPARTPYSTRITHFDLTPYPEYYDDPILDPYDWWGGTGNPGDFDAQYGLNFALTGKTGDDAYNSTATLSFGDPLPPYKTSYTTDPVKSGDNTLTYKVALNNAGTLSQQRSVATVLDSRLTIVSADLTINDSGTKVSQPTKVDGQTLTWQFTLPADQTATIMVVAKINLKQGDATKGITSYVIHSDGININNDVTIPMITPIEGNNEFFLPTILK
jgi:immune inhibitor A